MLSSRLTSGIIKLAYGSFQTHMPVFDYDANDITKLFYAAEMVPLAEHFSPKVTSLDMRDL